MKKVLSVIIMLLLSVTLLNCGAEKGKTTKDTIKSYYTVIEDQENKEHEDGVVVNEYEEGKFILSFYDNSEYKVNMTKEDKSSYVDLNVGSKLYDIFDKDDRVKEVKYKVFLKYNDNYTCVGYGTIDRDNYKDIKDGLQILKYSKDTE